MEFFCDVCRVNLYPDDEHIGNALLLCQHCADALREFGYLQRTGIDYVVLRDAQSDQQKRDNGRQLGKRGGNRGVFGD